MSTVKTGADGVVGAVAAAGTQPGLRCSAGNVLRQNRFRAGFSAGRRLRLRSCDITGRINALVQERWISWASQAELIAGPLQSRASTLAVCSTTRESAAADELDNMTRAHWRYRDKAVVKNGTLVSAHNASVVRAADKVGALRLLLQHMRLSARWRRATRVQASQSAWRRRAGELGTNQTASLHLHRLGRTAMLPWLFDASRVRNLSWLNSLDRRPVNDATNDQLIDVHWSCAMASTFVSAGREIRRATRIGGQQTVSTWSRDRGSR